MECEVSKGTIYFESIGEGFPLIFLHAMGTDHRSMKAWAEPIFARLDGYRRIYVDLPAHGHSMIDSSLRTSDDMLNNLLNFIDAVYPDETFSLIGHSFGGYLAQGIMNQRTDRVRGICLIAPAIHVKNRTRPEKIVLEKDEELLENLDPETRIAFETLMIYQNSEKLALFLEEIQPGRMLANREFLMSDWREEGYYLSEKPFENRLKIEQTSLFIAGKQDAICGYKDYLPFLDLFPQSTLAVLDGAGHLLPIDKRETVQQLVGDWVKMFKL